MAQKPETENKSRRDFLKLAATSAPVAAVAVAAGTDEAEAASATAGSSGLADTEHTRAYYASARF